LTHSSSSKKFFKRGSRSKLSKKRRDAKSRKISNGLTSCVEGSDAFAKPRVVGKRSLMPRKKGIEGKPYR